jgi:ZU5 domain
MKPTLRRLAALALGTLTLASCGSEPLTRPQLQQSPPEAPASSLLSGLTSLIGVNGLQRTTPLAAPITVTKAIGPEGGTLAIPQAGVTVTVPRGALATTTTITMTARAGSLVAYDFAPHGVVFAKPLAFSQQLRGTNATLLSAPLLGLGYYEDPSLLSRTGGLVSELLNGTVNTLSWTFTSTIPHFSGYMVSCGRRG